MAINFDTLYPWNSIKEVVIRGKYMVRIPKFYYKVGACPEGSEYAGKTGYWVSGKKEEGFEIHPAFMRDGKEIPYFFIGAYESGQNLACAPNTDVKPQVTKQNAINLSASLNVTNSADPDYRGWHLQNIYEQSAINMLIMIECGTPDVNSAIATGQPDPGYTTTSKSGQSSAVWRGIHEWWGHCFESVDGIFTGSNSIVNLFDKEGKGVYGATTANLGTAGWVSRLTCVNGALLPTSTGANNFGSYKWNNSSAGTINVGFRGNDANVKISGLFSVAFNDSYNDNVSASGGPRALVFRLAKYPEY